MGLLFEENSRDRARSQPISWNCVLDLYTHEHCAAALRAELASVACRARFEGGGEIRRARQQSRRLSVLPRSLSRTGRNAAASGEASPIGRFIKQHLTL